MPQNREINVSRRFHVIRYTIQEYLPQITTLQCDTVTFEKQNWRKTKLTTQRRNNRMFSCDIDRLHFGRYLRSSKISDWSVVKDQLSDWFFLSNFFSQDYKSTHYNVHPVLCHLARLLMIVPRVFMHFLLSRHVLAELTLQRICLLFHFFRLRN